MRGELLAKNKLLEKIRESMSATLPIIVIVLVLASFLVSVPAGTVLCFLWGAFLAVVGMMLFNIGAEVSMAKIGGQIGSSVTKSRKLPVIITVALLVGIVVTVAEPDLQVLSAQVSAIPRVTLIVTVAVGVGIFLVAAVLRMLLKIRLSGMLIFFYVGIFILAFFVPKNFIAVAFDSGGVTTGPMTVPFIMAFGVGISEIRSDRRAADDSFGLVSLCSAGPIIAVMILGIVYGAGGAEQTLPSVPEAINSTDISRLLINVFPVYAREIAVSLLPILLIFIAHRLFFFRGTKQSALKIMAGIVYTYVGLVIFLTGVNAGFMPMGRFLGEALAGAEYRWAVVPVAMVIGFFVVRAEPAVFVLNRQVEQMTNGGIPAKVMGLSLSVGVALSLGLSMLRILLGIPIMFFLIPGYFIALVISFFVPKIYTAIAFDSGGVASGPMTAAFLLPFAQGACLACGGNLATDAFGIVAMVAMTPLITIQILGLASLAKSKRPAPVSAPVHGLDSYADDEIIGI